MKTLRTGIVLALAIAFTSCQKNASESIEPSSISSAEKVVLAKTGNEYVNLVFNPKVNIIRSRKDLDKIISNGQTPLRKLSSKALAIFRSEIVEMKHSIGGMNIGVIRDGLSYNDFCEVMALFGMDVDKGYWGLSQNPAIMYQMKQGGSEATTMKLIAASPNEDYQGYACAGKGTHNCIAMNNDYICMHTCATD